MGYLIPKPSMYKNSSGINKPIDKWVHSFSKSIISELNVIAQLGLNLLMTMSQSRTLATMPQELSTDNNLFAHGHMT